MDAVTISPTIQAVTKFTAAGDRKIAYRTIGAGDALIWCNRFRGTMDDWDPAFIDRLAKKYMVVIFDYTGVGLSTGELPLDIPAVAEDVRELAVALQLERFIIGGWSYGGFVAQTFSVLYPAMITHTVLIGTKPAGITNFPSEQIFFDVALKLNNDLHDEEILFFEPVSKKSRKAAAASHERIARRTTDKDIPVPEAVWNRYITGGKGFEADTMNVRQQLAKLKTPVLVISGDHEIVFPVANWYALTGQMPNLYLFVLPRAGHGPQHQYPKLCAKYISHFIEHYHH